MAMIAMMLAVMTVFVSPNGDDANPGTAERPFATAARARDFLRSAKDRGKAEVVFRSGVYTVRETLALDARDSGTTWRGEDGAVFDGGFAVKGLRKVDASDSFAIQQLSPVAVSNVLVADVKAAGYRTWERQCRYGGAVRTSGPFRARSTRCTDKDTVLERMTDLWCNGGPMELAREPDTKFLKLSGIDNGEVSFVTACGMREKLARERELMVCGFWHWNYLDETAAVQSMSRDGKVVMDDCIFVLSDHYRTMNANQPYFFVNALCALDQPGEWFLDRTDGKLYLIPLKLKKGPDNRFPEQRFVLSEFADDFVSVSNGVDIVFENLAFEHGKRHGIVANGSRAIAVRNCRIERLGGRAVVFDRVWEARIEDCVVRYMGTAGVQLVSGDRVTLESGGSVVRGNEISFTSQRRRTYSPALDLDGVGTLVEKNCFHDLRSSAINMRGNDQMVCNNFIERAVLESDDQGALDTYGYVSFQGNRIVGNVWKDIGGTTHDGYVAGQAGVRLDDAISGVYIASNVFINAAKGNFGALHMNGGRANVVEDNVFVNCRSKRDAAVTIGVNTQWAWNHRLSQKQWQSTPLWHEDMFSEAYRKYPMMREKDLVTVFKDDNVVRRNYVTGCRDVLQRSHYNPNGYYYEYFGGEDGLNVHRGDPRVEVRFMGEDGSAEADVRLDRRNGAEVRILKRVREIHTPETSKLFERRVDPVSGVVSYALCHGKPTDNRQSLYFLIKSMTEDGRFLVFSYTRGNERIGCGPRQIMVADLLEDKVVDLGIRRCDFVETRENYLVWCTPQEGVMRMDLAQPGKAVRLCETPAALRKLGKVVSLASHLTLTRDRKGAFLDACVRQDIPGTTNKVDVYVQGLLTFETGEFEEWNRETGHVLSHGQLCPANDRLALCAWEFAWEAPGKAYLKKTGWYPRMWLVEPGKSAMIPARDRNFASHEVWDDDGTGFSWCGRGNFDPGDYVYHHDLATGRQERYCGVRGARHNALSPDKRYVVCDEAPEGWWRGGKWRVAFWNREAGRGVWVYTTRPPLCPREKGSKLHPDPHPQFVCNGRYIVSTANNGDGHMDLYVTPVAPLVEMTAKSASNTFGDGAAASGEVRRVILPERLDRGNTSIVPLSPVDEASWLAPRDGSIGRGGSFFRFRNSFDADGVTPLRFHVSADERFILLLDGQVIARGPDRGEPNMWFFQTYETVPGKGRHVFDAVVWKMNDGQSPLAQMSWRLGFVFAAEGAYDAALTTGKAKWRVGRLTGTEMTKYKYPTGVGAECVVHGVDLLREEPAAFEEPVVVRGPIRPNPSHSSRKAGWLMYPSQLPAQLARAARPGRCVAVDDQAFVTNGVRVRQGTCDEWCSNAVFRAESAGDPRRADFDALVREGRPLSIPAHASVRYLWNLDQYYCAYPEMKVSGGKGSSVRWGWAESLYVGDCLDWHTVVTDKVRKGLGDRNAFVGKYFYGIADTFLPSGPGASFYSAPWWHCGKFCLVEVKTGDEPLTIESLGLTETRYPFDPEAYFHCSDESLEAVQAVCLRGLQDCMHEMHFDCPYYEQQMYGGDTRLQMLMTQVLSPDDGLNRQAFRLFEVSQRDNGMISMNYPTKWLQESTTFSEYWAMMLGDYAMRRDNPAWVRSRLPAVRRLLFGLEGRLNGAGLQEDPPGWSFVDWVPEWSAGLAPGSQTDVSSVNNLIYLLALQKVALAEKSVGEEELAARWLRQASGLGERILARFWCEERGLLADTAAKDCFSEHAQALAILTGILSADRQARVVRGLAEPTGLAQCTASFSSYLFEAYFKCGRADLFLKKLDVWREYVRMGLHTPLEGPGDARSDCHAWSANPIYHLHAGVAGVNPAEPGFKSVRISPNPGPLSWIRSKTSTPKGYVVEDLTFSGGRVSGTVRLPAGLGGTFVWEGKSRTLVPGENRIGR